MAIFAVSGLQREHFGCTPKGSYNSTSPLGITCSAPEAFPCLLHGYAYSIEMGGQCIGDWDLFLGDRSLQGGRNNAERSPDLPSQQRLWL